jgi:hypothetical protein
LLNLAGVSHPGHCSVDEMGGRIDDLEKSIGELMTQAGFDEQEAKKEAEKMKVETTPEATAPTQEEGKGK